MLRTRKRATFRQLTKDTDHRLKVIVRFLAVLELVKRGEADVVQSGSFGEIDVEWLGENAAATSVLADEYDGTWVEGEAPHAKDGSGDIVLDARKTNPVGATVPVWPFRSARNQSFHWRRVHASRPGFVRSRTCRPASIAAAKVWALIQPVSRSIR